MRNRKGFDREAFSTSFRVAKTARNGHAAMRGNGTLEYGSALFVVPPTHPQQVITRSAA